jgi:CHAD domain-containing protein
MAESMSRQAPDPTKAPSAPDPVAASKPVFGPSDYAAWALQKAARAVLHVQEDPHEAIHEVRLAVKRLRALWRLVRPHVGAPLATRENATLREAARRLGGVRDEQVIAETLDLLLRHTRGAAARDQGAALRKSLFAAGEPGIDFQAALAEGSRVVRASSGVMKVLPWEGWNWASIAPGLGRTYRRASARMRGCAAKRESAAFHEWRKRVKDLQYQLEMAVFTWPALRGVQERVRDLARLLGEMQDLAVLRERLTARMTGGEANTAPQLLRALDRQLGKLKDRTLLRGLALFHLAPRDWLRSIKPKPDGPRR